MPRLMVDTDMCSSIMKRSHPMVIRRLQPLAVGDVCMPVITKAELLYGVEVSPRRARDSAAFRVPELHRRVRHSRACGPSGHRTVQGLLGEADVSTTMIYTHVLNRVALLVRSRWTGEGCRVYLRRVRSDPRLQRHEKAELFP